MSLTSGASSAESASGGAMTITAGAGVHSSTAGAGGDVSIAAGLGATANGGSVSIVSGVGTATNSGDVTLASADGGSSGERRQRRREDGRQYDSWRVGRPDLVNGLIRRWKRRRHHSLSGRRQYW